MKVAILGYGVQGRSTAKYWHNLGHEVTVCDANPDLELPSEFRGQLGPNYLQNLDGFDLVVRSQSVYPGKFQTTAPVTTEYNEFFKRCRAPIIGVTGTKGKGTTTTLIAKILEAAGHKVWIGGNIGAPLLDFVGQVGPSDYVVLELASYQLMDATSSPQIAVALMIVPEHLDWHKDVDEYVAAKGNIFKHQKPKDLAIYNAKNAASSQIAQLSVGQKLPYLDPEGAHVDGDSIKFQETVICSVSDVGLLGPHNLQNVCAAVAATFGIVDHPEPLARAIREFKGLEHRLELAGEVDGVRYYDDSFATTPETAIAALKAFDASKVIILGGSDKGSNYEELAREVKSGNVRQVIAIGDMAGQISKDLRAVGYDHITTGLSKMADIVQSARQSAKPGDVVLLSPACASFGLFKDYKDRGNQFKVAVAALGKH